MIGYKMSRSPCWHVAHSVGRSRVRLPSIALLYNDLRQIVRMSLICEAQTPGNSLSVTLSTGYSSVLTAGGASDRRWLKTRLQMDLLTYFLTKQYSLLLAERQWCCTAAKVTTGLGESNCFLPLEITCRWLPRDKAAVLISCLVTVDNQVQYNFLFSAPLLECL